MSASPSRYPDPGSPRQVSPPRNLSESRGIGRKCLKLLGFGRARGRLDSFTGDASGQLPIPLPNAACTEDQSARKTLESSSGGPPWPGDRFSGALSGRPAGSVRLSKLPVVSGFEIITEKAELKELAKALMHEDVVAFDTEADSFYHYYDKVCLIQVATRKKCWLIDPLALGGPKELAPLAPVFSSPKVRVLFHAAEYDIYVLKRDAGFEFSNLFDTMVSSQLLGYPAIGLAALVERHFGVTLPKEEQRSDWSRRPLTDKQLSYAASDVLYLIKLAEKLEKELIKAGTTRLGGGRFSNVMRPTMAGP